MPPMPGYESRRGLVASRGGWANATASGVNSQIRALDPRFPKVSGEVELILLEQEMGRPLLIHLDTEEVAPRMN